MRMTPRVIVIGGLAVVLGVISIVVFLPWAIFRPTPTLYTNPYTSLEQAGRDVYTSQGCTYCHTQFTRPLDVTPSDPSVAGQYVYDKPHQLGEHRTGPDLSNIGFKRGDEWEKQHLFAPREFTPNSIMPNFIFLKGQTVTVEGRQVPKADALVAYLNTLGNKQLASTDLMIGAPYLVLSNPYPVTKENWRKGREVYARRCFTCHGCAGKGDGPYAMLNNARPADLRQQKYYELPDAFDFWRISTGVPGTVMPIWSLSLNNDERWLVALYVKHAYMDMVPHYTDEGDLPKAYDLPNPTKVDTETLTAGKALYTANCTYCHGYSGHGMGPSATGVPLYPGLLPEPPNFEDTSTYQDWKWGDYYWRISESIPMRPMMPWKEMWPGEPGSPGSIQRWYLADYVRDMLVFPKEDNEPSGADTPPKFEPLKMPASANATRGRLVYFKRCWLCHGAGGQGEGQQGQNLRPVPANFTDADVAKMVDGRWFWRVSAGVDGAAMPIWHLLLSQQDEWNVIAYIKTTYVFPGAAADSHGLAEQRRQLRHALKLQEEGSVEYQALTSPYTNDAAAIADGKTVYETYCAECHGATFTGDGEFGKKMSPKPANLTNPAVKAKSLDDWYSAVAQGRPGTSMSPYKVFLADRQVWDVVWYTRQALGIKEPPQ